MKQEAMR